MGGDGPNEVADALTLPDQLARGEVGGVSVAIETDAGLYGSRSAAGARLYHADETESLVGFPTTQN